MNSIEDFANTFPSLISYSLNLLLWKKILAPTLFKIITVIRPSTIIRVLLMGDQDLQIRDGLRATLPTHSQNFKPRSPVRCHSLPKKQALSLSFMSQPVLPLIVAHIEKKVSLIAFRQVSRKTLPVVQLFSFIITTCLKKLTGIKPLSTKQCPAKLSPRIIPPVSSISPEIFSFLQSCLLSSPYTDYPAT